MTKRRCFYIPPTAYVEGCGYVPSLVTEGEPGHAPMTGNGTGSQPWYWGETYEQARAIAEQQNIAMGISPKDAVEIIASSMAASNA